VVYIKDSFNFVEYSNRVLYLFDQKKDISFLELQHKGNDLKLINKNLLISLFLKELKNNVPNFYAQKMRFIKSST